MTGREFLLRRDMLHLTDAMRTDLQKWVKVYRFEILFKV